MRIVTRLIQAGSVLGEHSCNSVKVEYSLRGISHRFWKALDPLTKLPQPGREGGQKRLTARRQTRCQSAVFIDDIFSKKVWAILIIMKTLMKGEQIPQENWERRVFPGLRHQPLLADGGESETEQCGRDLHGLLPGGWPQNSTHPLALPGKGRPDWLGAKRSKDSNGVCRSNSGCQREPTASVSDLLVRVAKCQNLYTYQICQTSF